MFFGHLGSRLPESTSHLAYRHGAASNWLVEFCQDWNGVKEEADQKMGETSSEAIRKFRFFGHFHEEGSAAGDDAQASIQCARWAHVCQARGLQLDEADYAEA